MNIISKPFLSTKYSGVGEDGIGVLVGKEITVEVKVFVGWSVWIEVKVSAAVGLANRFPPQAEINTLIIKRSNTFSVVRCIE